MGYETKLLVGESASYSSDEPVYGDLIIEDGEAYRPMLKDESGDFLKSGKKQTYFMIAASIDLCKCGSDSNISKVDFINTDESHQWYWYEGNERKIEDSYGDKPKPVKINIVLDALKKDQENDPYRRFKWAIALLESMKDEKGFSVLFYGH